MSFIEGKLQWSLSGSMRKSTTSSTSTSKSRPMIPRNPSTMSTQTPSTKKKDLGSRKAHPSTLPLTSISTLSPSTPASVSASKFSASTPATKPPTVHISPTPVSPLQTFPSSSYTIFSYHDLVSANIQRTVGKGRDEAFGELFDILLKEDVRDMLGRDDVVDEILGVGDLDIEDVGDVEEMHSSRGGKKDGMGVLRDGGKNGKSGNGHGSGNQGVAKNNATPKVLGEKDRNKTMNVSGRKNANRRPQLGKTANTMVREKASPNPAASTQSNEEKTLKQGDVGYNPLKSPSVEDFFTSTSDPLHPDTPTTTHNPTSSPRPIKNPTLLTSKPLSTLKTEAANLSSLSQKHQGQNWQPTPTTFDASSIILTPSPWPEDPQVLVNKTTKDIYVRRVDGKVYAVDLGDSLAYSVEREKKEKNKKEGASKVAEKTGRIERKVKQAMRDGMDGSKASVGVDGGMGDWRWDEDWVVL